MIDRRLERAGEVSWTFGCGLSAVVALACAIAGSYFDVTLVARAQVHCGLDLSSGEKLSEGMWLLTRFAVIPVVAVLSAVLALPLHLLARLPPVARRVWPVPVLSLLAVGLTIAGPVAMVMYDVATEGTPGDCVLPWWPSWLPS